MGHNHEHTHTHEFKSLNRAFTAGIALNVAFVVVEFAVGFASGSVGLISDAGHNLSDVASLALAMIAFRLARVHASTRYTYGFKKSTVLVSLLNAIILLIAVGMIIAESIGKIIRPEEVEGGVIAWVAAVGVVINAFTAWLFMRDREKDLNVRGAYLHMAADALISVGVVISGIVIAHTQWYVLDPIIGLIIAAVIIHATWSLLSDSIRLSLDGVPSGVIISDIESAIKSVEGVGGCHHLHIWAISTTETALTSHVVISDTAQMETIKRKIKDVLRTKSITHATLEFETTECAETDDAVIQ